jgi:hypothetical protein
LIVLDAKVTGTNADADAGQVAAVRIAAGPRPRRSSRPRSSDRPRSIRSFNVDTATPSCAAASPWVWPSR